MAKFNVGDKIYCQDCPDDVCTVIEVDIMKNWLPNYTLTDSSGNVFESLCLGWDKVVTHDDALRYGEVLTDDTYEIYNPLRYNKKIKDIRIRTIRYESRIFYHKMMNGEVVEFKELTV